MIAELQPPLTPADCDLRDFLFMPLDVLRLRDSDIAVISTGDEFRCAVLLWCASWHQVPAASLPDDDVVLSGLSGFGRVVKEWKRVRDGALRGWVKCADGRLYHPVVAEKANEAWRGRLEYREKKEAERLRKAEQRAAKKALDDAALGAGNPPPDTNLSAGQNQCVRRTDNGSPQDNPNLSAGNHSERDSGQWTGTVDSGQLTSKPDQSSHASSSQAAAPATERDDPGASPKRNVAIAVLLRGLNVRPFTADHPHALEWASNPRITDELLREAVADSREYKPEGQAVHPNYLAKVLADKLAPKVAKPKWNATDRSIEETGRSLGMTARPSESWREYENRIAAEIAKRRRGAVGGPPA